MTLEGLTMSGSNGNGGGHGDKKHKDLAEIVNEGAGAVVKYFQEVSASDFKTRIKRFEEFHDPDLNIRDLFSQHAGYIARGNPEDREKYPGAYEVAHKHLGTLAKKNTDTLNEDQVREVLQKYVEQFLKSTHPGFDKMMAQAKKENWDKKHVRDTLGDLFGSYHKDPETGKGTNPLNDSYIKELAGKAKLRLIKELSGLAAGTQQMYTGFLIRKATEDLLKQPEDHNEFTGHVASRLKDAGLQLPDNAPLHIRSVDQLTRDYSTLLSGGDMSKLDYQQVGKEKAGKPKKATAAHGGGH
jgi:hypothetical protein